MTEYRLFKGDIPKGRAWYRKKGSRLTRWQWQREHGGREGFASLEDILARIDQLCHSQQGAARAERIDEE